LDIVDYGIHELDTAQPKSTCKIEDAELDLKDAGGNGRSQVFKVKFYYISLDDEALSVTLRDFRA
jgi:hypothetical protein